jgi:hypothetical protein
LNTNAVPGLAPVFLEIAMINCGAKSAGDIIGQMFNETDFNSLNMTTEQAANAIAVAVQGHADNSNLEDFSLDATLGTLATCMFNRNTQRMIMVAKFIKDENLVPDFVPGLGDDSAFQSNGTSTFPDDSPFQIESDGEGNSTSVVVTDPSVTESPLSPLPTDSVSLETYAYCFGINSETEEPFLEDSSQRKYCPLLDPLPPFSNDDVRDECDLCCATAEGADDNFGPEVVDLLKERCRANMRTDPDGRNPGFRCEC